MIERKRFSSIATLVLIFFIFAAGQASAQEGTPPATPSAVAAIPLAAIPDGTWLVGQEVTAGIYAAPGGEQCSWKRLSGFGGTSDEVVASAFGAVRPIVEITKTDRGFSTSNCGEWTLVAMEMEPPPPATPMPKSTPLPTASMAPTALPTPTAFPIPLATVEAPRGWKRIEDDRLGYSLAVPFPWVTFDLRAGVQNPIVERLVGEEALAALRHSLETPYVTDGFNIGVMAIEPDLSELFARPPFPLFLNVSRAYAFDEFTGDELVAVVDMAIEPFSDVQVHSIKAETVNGWPAVQAVASLDLRRNLEIDLELNFVFTFVQANQKTYLLTIATRSEKAEAKQEVIEQIVGTFQPKYIALRVTPTARPTSAWKVSARPTATPTLPPTATPTRLPTATPTPSPTAIPTPTVAPTPIVTIPQGWNSVVNRRLGYSLAVPRGWFVLDVHSGQLSQILRFIDPGAAQEAARLLSTPGAENAGHVAVKLDIFSRPPIKAVAGVGIAPLEDGMTTESVIQQIEEEIETFDLVPLAVQSLKAGTTNNLSSIQGVVTADLSDHGLFDAHAVMTALRANDKAYILFVAVPAGDAEAMQQQIDQIVGTFRPE